RGFQFQGMGQRAGGAFTRVADNFYPHDPGFKPLPRVGLTRLNLVTNGIGQSAFVRVIPGEPEQMLEQTDGLAYAAVTNSTDSLDQIRNQLSAAARAKSGDQAARPGSSASGQVWSDVVEGKVPLVAHPNSAAAVLHVLKMTEQYKNIKLVMFLAGDAVAET